ncbi:MAG: electron transfer flavoprotein subunit alpha/FixB family protein [Deltaproteobacteria bacterium]|nr:MAG: electron transfer flavoprotein subunit alpha/FixB family protein [Deltaproteobacteria bacterium]
MKTSNTKEYQGIWVFIEQEEGRLSEVSLELLTAARCLAEKKKMEICAVLLGDGGDAIAESLPGYGADRVYLASHPALRRYLAIPYTKIVSRLVLEKRPDIFLLPATSVGSDLAPRIAARVDTGLSAHCTTLDLNEKGELMQVVPAFGGKVMATILCPTHRPQMATVRPGVFRKGDRQEKQGKIERLSVELSPEDLRQKILDVHYENKAAQAIEDAEIVVAGGAGIGNGDDWKWVEKLATALNGVVGGTRPPLDEGWIHEDQMIGQSGKTIRPKLYLGIGISGVIQHTVGIQDAKTIIAVNHDPKAAIFETADLGVVADYRKIVPLLIEELQRKDPF